jgi:hypothetical protein
MRWNVYINRRRKGSIVSEKHVVEVPGTSGSDGRAVTIYGAKHFRVSTDAVLAIPTPSGETKKVEATITPPPIGRPGLLGS